MLTSLEVAAVEEGWGREVEGEKTVDAGGGSACSTSKEDAGWDGCDIIGLLFSVVLVALAEGRLRVAGKTSGVCATVKLFTELLESCEVSVDTEE